MSRGGVFDLLKKLQGCSIRAGFHFQPLDLSTGKHLAVQPAFLDPNRLLAQSESGAVRVQLGWDVGLVAD